MSFESEFKELLPHTVTIETYSGQTANAVPAYNSGSNYSGRVVNHIRMVRDMYGNEQVSNTTIWLNTTADIGPEDRVTLPSGFTPNQPRIISVARYPDEDGLHHTRIYC